MCNLHIPQQTRGNSTQIILKESGKKILQILGKKNKQSFINVAAPNLHKKDALSKSKSNEVGLVYLLQSLVKSRPSQTKDWQVKGLVSLRRR